jgi:hypothetical protein
VKQDFFGVIFTNIGDARNLFQVSRVDATQKANSLKFLNEATVIHGLLPSLQRVW